MRYRKKPVIVDAIRYTCDIGNRDEVIEFGGSALYWSGEEKDTDQLNLIVRTLEGMMTLKPGDWLVRGIKGECYPVRDDIFRLTYEKVE